MAQYLSYHRNGMNLTEHITAALAHFQRYSGQSPAAVVVNPKDVTAAGEVVKALALPTLAVIGNGGAMVGEVWLQVQEKQ